MVKEENNHRKSQVQILAVPAGGKDLDSEIDPRFGRCKYFILVKNENQIEDVIENPGMGQNRGAGILAAQSIVNNAVDAVAVDNIGPNAFEALKESGIDLYKVTERGTVREIISKYNKKELDKLEPVSKPGRGRGRGRGKRFGRTNQ